MGPEVIILWVILSFVVAIIAGNRKLGFGAGLILSILLSPVIGLIIALASARKDWASEESTKLMNSAIKTWNKGKKQEAINEMKRALERKSDHPKIHYNLAIFYNNMGQQDLAIKHLDRAVQNGFGDYEKIETDPSLESLRQTDKFKQFSEKGYKL